MKEDCTNNCSDIVPLRTVEFRHWITHLGILGLGKVLFNSKALSELKFWGKKDKNSYIKPLPFGEYIFETQRTLQNDSQHGFKNNLGTKCPWKFEVAFLWEYFVGAHVGTWRCEYILLTFQLMVVSCVASFDSSPQLVKMVLHGSTLKVFLETVKWTLFSQC